MCGRDSVTSTRMRTSCEKYTFRSALRQVIVAREERPEMELLLIGSGKITALRKLGPSFSLYHSIWFMVSLQ